MIISGVTRGDDGLQARFGFWHSWILEVPTTEPEFMARVEDIFQGVSCTGK